MNKIFLVAALIAASAVQPGWAADKAKSKCSPANAAEAEAAIRFMTDVMVIRSVCQDTHYAQFRLRNKDAIMAYQKVLIAHLHGAPAFDRWNTSLANQSSQKQAGLAAQLCQQSAARLKPPGRVGTE